ncbi:fucose-1-phosphate guanylyltransferase [Ciona intestinalis]
MKQLMDIKHCGEGSPFGIAATVCESLYDYELIPPLARKMNAETRKRFRDFDQLRGKNAEAGMFWDVVVITAADPKQKEVYEIQISSKLKANELPKSADYLVVDDPPGYKIGNGGSTMVVLEFLHEKYGSAFSEKKCIIIHAGGYSQRLLIASALGKVFTSVPLNEPLYQMLELKLASYTDFPKKIKTGGVFVCCSDTFETYTDCNKHWDFAASGMTGLAHPSSITIGTTHGVYLLDHDAPVTSLIRSCKKFLHKPSAERMRATPGCVLTTASSEIVLTDSAFFMAPDVCNKLRLFYKSHKPLTCEIDAYGDFMQALGSESDNQYITNSANVVCETDSLVALRQKVFELLSNTSLQVVCLACVNSDKDNKNVTSHFYHFGTTEEYMGTLTKDTTFLNLVGSDGLAYSAGVPYSSVPDLRTPMLESDTPQDTTPNVHGLMGTIQQRVKRCMYSIAASVMYSTVTIGDGTVVEYCKLKENVSIGSNCVLSNCMLKPNTKLPHGMLLHTLAISTADKEGLCGRVKYVTVVFSVYDNMKSFVAVSDAGNLMYLKKPLKHWFQNPDLAFSGVKATKASLWYAKLFPVCDTIEESSQKSIDMIMQLKKNSKIGVKTSLSEGLLSMDEALKVKNVTAMLSFRLQLLKEIQHTRSNNSIATSFQGWTNTYPTMLQNRTPLM